MDAKGERLFMAWQEAMMKFFNYIQPTLDPEKPKDKEILDRVGRMIEEDRKYRMGDDGTWH